MMTMIHYTARVVMAN